MTKVKAAILGSGHIGTDLMVKIARAEGPLQLAAMVGIDPDSPGLARAARMGVAATAEGVEGLRRMADFGELGIVFDATGAAAHRANLAALADAPLRIVDLTPAAVGPYLVPSVNPARAQGERVVNMVTCGGQATVPIVAALSRVARVHYAEIVATIASRSAGPGTRANIDEFTQTTARALESVGGAARGKAIIILNPAEPPLVMRDTVICLCEEADPAALSAAVESMVREVQGYVPGYRLKQGVQVEPFAGARDLPAGLKVSVFLEVEGAGHHLPRYAGNLDVMTSAALRTAETMLGATSPEAGR